MDFIITFHLPEFLQYLTSIMYSNNVVNNTFVFYMSEFNITNNISNLTAVNQQSGFQVNQAPS